MHARVRLPWLAGQGASGLLARPRSEPRGRPEHVRRGISGCAVATPLHAKEREGWRARTWQPRLDRQRRRGETVGQAPSFSVVSGTPSGTRLAVARRASGPNARWKQSWGLTVVGSWVFVLSAGASSTTKVAELCPCCDRECEANA